MGTKEKLLTLIPTDEDILVETMFYADEVKEAPSQIIQPEVGEAELQMAKTLIATMVKDFEPKDYRNEYQSRLWEIIQQKIQGKEITVVAKKEANNVIDLMEALRQSLDKVNMAG